MAGAAEQPDLEAEPCEASLVASEALSTSQPARLAAVCGIESIQVDVPNATSNYTLNARRLWVWPEGLAAPAQLITHPALLFNLTLTDENGTIVQPTAARLELHVPTDWFPACPPDSCLPVLFHHNGTSWTQVDLAAIGYGNGSALMAAHVDSFSLFAVGGVRPPPLATETPANWNWALMLLFGAVAVVLISRVVTTPNRKPTAKPPETVDRKVSLLLRQMRDKDELLEFVNSAAHDLANPLTPIQLQLDLLSEAAEEAADEKQQRALSLVRTNVDQMEMLVGDLRDAAKLQAGRLTLFPEPVDLAGLTQEAADGYQPKALAAGVELTVAATGPVAIPADPRRLRQVLSNLLSNAIKFTPQGGRVDVAVSGDEVDALVTVGDTGLGLAAGDAERLFKPFSQVHDRAQKEKGTGLGLYIAKGIVESHGGRIGCSSDGPGLGSTFWFSLPRTAEEATKA